MNGEGGWRGGRGSAAGATSWRVGRMEGESGVGRRDQEVGRLSQTRAGARGNVGLGLTADAVCDEEEG